MSNNTSKFLANLRQRSAAQKTYGGNSADRSAAIQVRDCPNCGAGRARTDGVTHCAYCGFEFISTRLSDGLHITAEDNS